jgi:nitrogen-specific signal transduction histidine kinase/ActR/RegA family two-component response regulator
MAAHQLGAESFLFQWNFFERAISNYSIILKMFQNMEAEKDLLAHMPKVFVEETVFDSCQLVVRGEGTGEFFSIDGSLKAVDWEKIERRRGQTFSPTVTKDVFGYGTLYVYPLKRNIHVFGYLLFGKKKSITLDVNTVRDLELLCEIMNRFILLNMRIDEFKAEEDAKLHQLDTRLATTKTLLENVIDQFPHALLLVDEKGSICFANRTARSEFIREKDLVGERIEDVLGGIEKVLLGKDLILRGELHYRRGDEYKLYSLESYPIKDGKGRTVFKSLVLKDVVDERVEEEENTYRGRMESIGKLAGGVAHDFNNVLTGILGYASLVKKMAPQEGPLGRYAEVIEASAKRAASLTEHLLNFSRRQKTKTVDVVDLNSLLGDVLFLVRESFRTINVEKEFEASLPPITGDAGELQHVFLNLCINAKDAMPEGGTLTIKTSREAAGGKAAFAVVKIHDTGPGIDEDCRRRVFEPYFTTKTEHKKLGMGLYLVQKTVKRHGGFIELESGPETGTTFTLYFPFTDSVSEPLKELAQPAPDLRKRTILVVDDEEVVRELLAGLLSQEGYEVLRAENGKTAVALLESRAASIDLVVLDMIMPRMKGEQVLARLRGMPASPKVVISSGFMTEEQRDKLKEYGVDGFLDKPYSEEDALNAVRSVLARTQPVLS